MKKQSDQRKIAKPSHSKQVKQEDQDDVQVGLLPEITSPTLSARNILHLQQTIGNRATQQFLARRASIPQIKISDKKSSAKLSKNMRDDTVQRGFFGDIWSDVTDWVEEIADKADLMYQAKTLLEAEPVNVKKLLKLIRRSSPGIRRSLYDADDIRRSIVSTLSEEDRVEVLSAILKSVAYIPGWQSEMYQLMSPEEQEPINKKADDYFKSETGIERSLDPKSAVDFPLVRQWLRLRDLAIENDIKREVYEEEKKDKSEKRYSFYLQEGIDKMKNVKFGTALDIRNPDDINFKYWDLEIDAEFAKESGRAEQGMLIYNGEAPYPAMGVDELFEHENLKKWALDCAEFTQAVHLYARRHALGDKEFNDKVEDSGGKLTLRMHYSSQYETSGTYQRSSATDPMRLFLPDGSIEEVDEDIDQLLNDAPVGSRIVWRNSQTPGTDFYNENTTKVGADKYAAQGFEDKKYFSREELEEELAKLSYDKSTDGPFADYIQANIFVRTIEHVEIPEPKN